MPPSQAAEHLQSFIADCDRRTELAKKRLAETQDEISAEVAAKVSAAAAAPDGALPGVRLVGRPANGSARLLCLSSATTRPSACTS